MALDLVIDSHGPAIDRARNDFLQYKHRVRQDRATPQDILDDFDPFLRFITPFVYKAWHVKVKCTAVLARAGVLRPGLKFDRRTGKCRACGGMRGFFSPVSYVELGAAAGCPSCVLLLRGVEQYGPGKRALSRPRVYMMDSWNSGCAGRQFIRDKKPSATSHGAMGVTGEVKSTGLSSTKSLLPDPRGMSAAALMNSMTLIVTPRRRRRGRIRGRWSSTSLGQRVRMCCPNLWRSDILLLGLVFSS